MFGYMTASVEVKKDSPTTPSVIDHETFEQMKKEKDFYGNRSPSRSSIVPIFNHTDQDDETKPAEKVSASADEKKAAEDARDREIYNDIVQKFYDISIDLLGEAETRGQKSKAWEDYVYNSMANPTNAYFRKSPFILFYHELITGKKELYFLSAETVIHHIHTLWNLEEIIFDPKELEYIDEIKADTLLLLEHFEKTSKDTRRKTVITEGKCLLNKIETRKTIDLVVFDLCTRCIDPMAGMGLLYRESGMYLCLQKLVDNFSYYLTEKTLLQFSNLEILIFNESMTERKKKNLFVPKLMPAPTQYVPPSSSEKSDIEAKKEKKIEANLLETEAILFTQKIVSLGDDLDEKTLNDKILTFDSYYNQLLNELRKVKEEIKRQPTNDLKNKKNQIVITGRLYTALRLVCDSIKVVREVKDKPIELPPSLKELLNDPLLTTVEKAEKRSGTAFPWAP